jgi:mono/diheme cytochrome c family protein
MRLRAQPSKGGNSPPATSSPPMRTAARHYRQYCVRCHGNDYKGAAFRERGRRIPDFTSRAWQNSRTDAQLVVSVLEGKGARMPAFADRLSKKQAREVVRFIRTAGPTRPVAAEVAPRDFTSHYSELLMQLEELRKQYRELENGLPRPGPEAQGGASPARRAQPR